MLSEFDFYEALVVLSLNLDLSACSFFFCDGRKQTIAHPWIG